MSFTNILKSKFKRGQSVLEYILLLAALLAVATIAGSNLIPQVQTAGEDFVQAEVAKINGTFIPSGGGGGGPGGGGGGPGGGGGGCFLQGTGISLADGSIKAIDQIKIGDLVLGYKDNKIQPGKVIKTTSHPKYQGYLLITAEDGKQIKVTGNHPVFQGKNYKRAGQLKPGDSVFILENNALKPVKIKSIMVKNEIVDVYNLEVAKLHNYFAEGILCHNKPAMVP